jgi:hypothetical protein
MSWNSPKPQPIELETVYPRLRRIAGEMLSKEYRQRTMQGTELLHEALISLCDYRGLVTNSSHYVSLIVGSMKRILVDRSHLSFSQSRSAYWHCGLHFIGYVDMTGK